MRKLKAFHFLWLWVVLTLASFSSATGQELLSFIKNNKAIKHYTAITPLKDFSESYEIYIEQPIDHNKPNGKKFLQMVYVNHRNKKAITVMETEGYAAGNYENELSELLNANYICIEHRFFGNSRPDSIDNYWQYLTIWQAAQDHHYINQLFKSFYTGKWVSTGISKGGQTAIYYRRYFPNDVDATVGYVCPIALAVQDERVYTFLEQVGRKSCRDSVFQFQKQLLKNRNTLVKIIELQAKELGYQYNIPINEVFEYMVLEYSFAFWQWNADCATIPLNSKNIEQIYEHFVTVSPLDYFAYNDMRTFFYQALTEAGYYGYDIKPFGSLIKYVKNPSYEMVFPKGIPMHYQNDTILTMVDFITNRGNNMLYIYGEYDPWSACAVNISEKTNAVKIVKPGGTHATRIKNLPEEQKKLALETLEKWLK